MPLPVVGQSFEKVGIDIVGPLDCKTALGNWFIIIVMDYAIRYPEAVLLSTLTVPVVDKDLHGSRVGLLKEVISNRRANFMMPCGMSVG